MFCPGCGEDAGEAKFCPECGADLSAVRAARGAGGGAGGGAAGKTTGGYAAGKGSGGERVVQTPQAKPGRGINPITLWVVIGAIAAVAIAAVIIFGASGSKSNPSGASGATSSIGPPPALDVSGTYKALVKRANDLYDTGAKLMPNGVPTELAAQYFATAAQTYQAAWKKQPGDPKVGSDWATALFYSGDVDGALSQINVVLAKNASFQPGLYNKGLFLWHMAQNATGDAKTLFTTQAKAVLRAAVKINAANDVGKYAAQLLANIK